MSNNIAQSGAATPAVHPPARERLLELDALRGFAALGVLALHTVPRYFFWAWSCVDLFFILSGFLISSVLLSHAGSPRMLFSFYVRRALRIWPVYYLTWLATALICLAFGHAQTGGWPALPTEQWLSLVFLQYTDRYAMPVQPWPDLWYFGHSWSLASEEQFYLLWPLLFFAVRPRLRTVAITGALLLAAAAWMREQGYFFYLMLTRVDGLVFGIVLAYLASDRNGLFYRLPVRVWVLIAFAGAALLWPYMHSLQARNLLGPSPRCVLEVTAFCLFYSGIIATTIRSAGARWLAPLRHPLLVHFGRISFAIYMFQVPIDYLVLEAQQRGLVPNGAARALVWIATLLAAHLSYRLIERHALALKARFPYTR